MGRSRTWLALVAALGAVSASRVQGEGPSPERPDPPAPDLSPAGGEPEAAVDAVLAMLDARERPRTRRKWNNGPRHVPRARGAAAARAEALGLGDHLSTKRLLWSRPTPELLSAVPGARPSSLLWPVVGGRWGRGFGFTRRVRQELRHNGIDIGAPAGTAVRAAADGLVLYSDNTLRDLGNAVLILHPGGWTTLYAHNARTTVQPGWYVERGERIALVGQTGAAWGPHVHFELRDNGRWRDPAPFIVGYRDPSLAGPLVELGTTQATAKAAEGVTKPETEAETEAEAGTEAEAETQVEAEVGVAPALSFELGSLRVARRLLRGELRPGLDDEHALGRKFSNLLRPLKGAAPQRGFDARKHPALGFDVAPGAPVRVAADGVVVYSGEGLGRGHAVLVVHRGGWLTLYAGVERDGAAESGTRVLRGEWIGRVAAPEPGRACRLRFEWIADGKPADASGALFGE